MQVARGYNVPLNSHYDLTDKLHHMDKQMKLLLKWIDWIKQKHEKKKKQLDALNTEDILTSWHADVKLTFHLLKISIRTCQCWWGSENLFEDAGEKNPISRPAKLLQQLLSLCAAVIIASTNSTLSSLSWNKLNSNGVATAKTQPKQMYHILCACTRSQESK